MTTDVTDADVVMGDSTDEPVGAAAGCFLGVDMVSITELTDMLQASGPAFLDSCWTRNEQAYCAGSAARLAARWAAKEATMKALGHGIGEVDPLDIEVTAVEGDPPRLSLTRTAAAFAREAGLTSFALSLTHEEDFALAFVVAIRSGGRLTAHIDSADPAASAREVLRIVDREVAQGLRPGSRPADTFASAVGAGRTDRADG